jgi:heme/copper-type cytochrome/quinol oxidase subunit 2
MNSKPIIRLFYILTLLIIPISANAHTDLDSHAGIIANIIALCIVVLSIVLYFILSNRKRRKREQNTEENGN